ncbi:MAG: twitching motility protein PilT [Peptostreptococcaceae bacterium]|nr:twitching motility protein PilT [Peptostreptococcaceae bacterium]
MISIIASEKGTGKTKKIIDMVNVDIEKLEGNVVYIDDDNRHMYDLKHDVRFVNLEEFPVKTTDEFIGFIYGIIANNYDIEKIYIDGLYNIMGSENDNVINFIDRIEWLSEKQSIDCVMTLSCNPELLPEKIKKHLI